MLACSPTLHGGVLTCLACLAYSCTCILACLVCLHARLLACSRTYVFTCLACMLVLYPYLLTCLTCLLRSNILLLACFFDIVCFIFFIFEKLNSKKVLYRKISFYLEKYLGLTWTSMKKFFAKKLTGKSL